MKAFAVMSSVGFLAHSSEPCCKTCTPPLVKYFSTDAPHGFCGEACMDPAKFSLYKKFEANLTLAKDDNPCSKQYTPSNTKKYTDYDSTVTHGDPLGLLSVTLDLYAPSGMPDRSCCKDPLPACLWPGWTKKVTIFGTGPFCCPDSSTEEKPCASEPLADGADKLCMNDDDQKVYQTIKTNISNIQKDCIMNGAPGVDYLHHCIRQFMGSVKAGQDCMSDCVNKRTSLSTTCSSCFGQISACVYKNCVMHCLDAKSPGCLSCTKDHCLNDFVTCTGFDDLPPAGLSMPKELADQVVV